MFKGIVKSVSPANIGGRFGVNQYTTDMARRALGLAYSTNKDGNVQYFSRSKDVIKRAVIQTVSQAAYGTLRSYPRYIKFYEAKHMNEMVAKSNTSLANTNGTYYQLLKSQMGFTPTGATDSDKKTLIAGKTVVVGESAKMDSIVGNPVMDYLHLSVSESDYNKTYASSNKTFKEVFNIAGNENTISLVDLHAKVNVATKNNIKQTVVVGRDYSRKELISGGDLEITITGKLTSKYPDIYPEGEVQKFIKLMQYKGVVRCTHTILRQFGVNQVIITGFNLPTSEGVRNIQDYSFSCLAVEPDNPVELKLEEQETAERALEQENAQSKWIKLAKYGSQIVEPTILLNLTKVWL